MYVVKDLVPVSWKFVDNNNYISIPLTQVCFPVVPCKASLQEHLFFSGSFTHEARAKNKEKQMLSQAILRPVL